MLIRRFFFRGDLVPPHSPKGQRFDCYPCVPHGLAIAVGDVARQSAVDASLKRKGSQIRANLHTRATATFAIYAGKSRFPKFECDGPSPNSSHLEVSLQVCKRSRTILRHRDQHVTNRLTV